MNLRQGKWQPLVPPSWVVGRSVTVGEGVSWWKAEASWYLQGLEAFPIWSFVCCVVGVVTLLPRAPRASDLTLSQTSDFMGPVEGKPCVLPGTNPVRSGFGSVWQDNAASYPFSASLVSSATAVLQKLDLSLYSNSHPPDIHFLVFEESQADTKNEIDVFMTSWTHRTIPGSTLKCLVASLPFSITV